MDRDIPEYGFNPSMPRYGTPYQGRLLCAGSPTAAVTRFEFSNNFGQFQHTSRRRKKSNNSSQSSHSNKSATKSVDSETASCPDPRTFVPKYFCRGCQLHYDYYFHRGNRIGRIPCILPCGHTICQECINKSVRNKKVECFICNDKPDVQEMYDTNHYVIGHLANSKLVDKGFPNVKLCSSKPKKESLLQGNFMFSCGSDNCRNSGTVSCLNCFKLYCAECDDMIHKGNTKGEIHLRSTNEKFPYKLGHCDAHNSRKEIFCTDCQQYYCCYCFMDGHEGHSKEYSILLNENERQNLRTSYQILSARIEDLTKSLKTMQNSTKVNNIEHEITSKFADIHAKLYLIEKKLLAEAKERSNFENCNEGDTIISTSINEMKHLIQCFDESNSSDYNMKALLAKFMQMKNASFPTHLNYDRNLKLKIDEKIDKLEDYFELVSRSSEILPSASPAEPEDHSSSTDISAECLTETWNKVNEQPSKKTPTVTNPPGFDVGRLTVFVTHVNSANSFYVQPIGRFEQFKKFEASLKEFMKKSSNVSKVEKNALYLAPTMASSVEWGRVQVLEHLAEKKKWVVRFIDFGQVGIFSKKELKRLNVDFLVIEKPFAIECKLYRQSENEWSDEANEKFKEILSVNKKVYMLTKMVSVNISVVELFVSDSLSRLMPVSDLISVSQSDYAKMNIANLDNSSVVSVKNVFESTETFNVGESYDILMRYVQDPFHVYIQRASYRKFLTDMKDSLQAHYQDSECDVCFPVIGSDIVVFYPTSDNGNWHRGRVHNIDIVDKDADVFLVDWGKQVKIKWCDMRKLMELFQGTECLVLCAELADIIPKSAAGWFSKEGTKATNFLDSYCTDSTVLKMLVSESNPLKVALFENKGEFDENINAMLVEKDLAISTGKLSSKVIWPLKMNKNVGFDKGEFFPIQKLSDGSDASDEDIEGYKLKAKIVHFVNPYLIFISINSKQSESDALFEELQIHYKQQKYDEMKKLKVDENVVVFNDLDRNYYRARIEEIKDNKCSVFLLDTGETLWVEKSNLRPILPYFDKNFPNTVLRCHLANIKPAGGTDKWSNTAIEWFQRMFAQHKDIFVQKIENDNSKKSLPVTMWYSKVIQGSALEPSTYKFFSIEMRAVGAGLAFQIKKTRRLKEKPVPTEPVMNSMPEQSVQIGKPDEIRVRGNGDNSRKIFQWPSPDPLFRSEFKAMVTCVEAEAHIYVRELQLHDDYLLMEKHMKKHFDFLGPPKPFELYENQLVTILSEDTWYRGSVLEIVDEDTIRVMMVDFGSDHLVHRRQLHNRIMYTDVPALTRKICLHGIHPIENETWTADNTDTLQHAIPKHCIVVIRTMGKIPTADIFYENGGCFNDDFVILCPNLQRSDKVAVGDPLPHCILDSTENESLLSSDVCLNSTSSDMSFTSKSTKVVSETYKFIRPSVLSSEKMTSCELISAYNYDTVSLLFPGDPTKEREFCKMNSSIQKEAENLELLDDISIGAPCISLYEDDQKWYRAQIHEKTGDDEVVIVFYVDYGNFESVNLSFVRKIKPEWLLFPAYCSVARIDYKLVGINRSVEQRLFDLLEAYEGETVHAVSKRHTPFSVHLYDDNDDLIYSEFVGNGDVVL